MDGRDRVRRSQPLLGLSAGVWVIALIQAVVLLATSTRYGYHRDELYFIAAGAHPAFGYPDQPPLVPLLCWATNALAPESLPALRAPSALIAVATTIVVGLIAREVGGDARAQTGAIPTAGWAARSAARRGLLAGAIALRAVTNAVVALPSLPERDLQGSIVMALNPAQGETVGWPGVPTGNQGGARGVLIALEHMFPKEVPMAQTATRSRPTANGSATHRHGVHGARGGSVVGRTAELSDEVLKSIEAGQLAAIEAVHTFVESVDRALPHFGEGPSRRQQILDATMDMADRLVHAQYDFIRNLIDSTAKSLSKDDGVKAGGVR